MQVNGQRYALPAPGRPVVGFCMDGTSQDYIDAAIQAGCMPNWKGILGDPEALSFAAFVQRNAQAQLSRGTHALVTSAYPTFTNPNNVGIMTGLPPSQHGISGNYYVDDEDKPVIMTSAKLIRANSIFAALARAGVKVTIITVKDKLKTLLSHELDPELVRSGNVRCISVENLSRANTESLGVELGFDAGSSQSFETALNYAASVSKDLSEGRRAPDPYHPHASSYAIRLGTRLALDAMRNEPQGRSLFYITTTDYIQHAHPPGEPEANALMQELDQAIGQLHKAGAIVGMTADHGMNDKSGFNGEPRVVYLSDELQTRCGLVDGKTARVILPITDPYVAHHAALGGCGFVKLFKNASAGAQPDLQHIMKTLRDIPGIYTVVGAQDAAKAFDLPIDRIGDFVVFGDSQTALGSSRTFHAPQLEEAMNQRRQGGKFRLRSHGSMDEATVPMFVNRALNPEVARKLTTGKGRNWDLYAILLNGIHPDATPATY